jgi:hypothetical protein
LVPGTIAYDLGVIGKVLEKATSEANIATTAEVTACRR